MIFYSILAAIFAVHLAIFLAITPGPSLDRRPWNFGKYAYSNYPNRKIELIMTPESFAFNWATGEAVLSNFDLRYLQKLQESAVASEVGAHCRNRENQYGFSSGEPCIYLHVAKAFHWTAGLINTTLYSLDYLPFNCSFTSSEVSLTLPILSQPEDFSLPLDIDNNPDSRSFPFRNQENYRVPILGLILNLTYLTTTTTSLPIQFDGRVRCDIDFDQIGMTRPTDSVLERTYEIPTAASTTIRFHM